MRSRLCGEHVQPPETNWEEVNRAIAGSPSVNEAQVVSVNWTGSEAKRTSTLKRVQIWWIVPAALVSKGQFLAVGSLLIISTILDSLLMHRIESVAAVLFIASYAVNLDYFSTSANGAEDPLE